MEDILKKLNKEQKEAVLHTEGPAIILAGAGSLPACKIVAKSFASSIVNPPVMEDLPFGISLLTRGAL